MALEWEKGLNKFLYKALSGIAVFLVAMNGISLICLHFYTVFYAVKVSGYFAGLLSFFAPLLAMIYWFFASWFHTGNFVNSFSSEILVYLLWLPMPLIFYWLSRFFKENE